MSLLVFGDHGYDLNYLEADERNPPLTLEQAIVVEREEWAEDKAAANEFEASPMVRLPDTGGYVSASGMMPVAKAMTAYCKTVRCDAGVMLGDNIYPNGPTGGADGVSDAKRFDDILLRPFRGFGSFARDFRITRRSATRLADVARSGARRGHLHGANAPLLHGWDHLSGEAAGHPDVELFVLDTEVLLAGQTVYEAELADDGSELPPRILDERPAWTKPQTSASAHMVGWLRRRCAS